jgi:F-box domain
MEGAENSKRGKRDRISILPDRLLHLIMSFMTTQEAIQTCVLSKRWKNLWTTLPFLDFTQNYQYGGNFERLRIQYEMFIYFVSAALLLREPTDVHTFRFSCSRRPGCHLLIKSCVLYVLKHNPKVLDIKFFPELPVDGVFTMSPYLSVGGKFLLVLLNFPASKSCTLKT